MKKLILPICFLLLTLSACKDEVDPILICGVISPAEELTWLNEIVEELNESYLGPYFYVTAGSYQGQSVFLIENCCPNCNSVVPVYNCEGESLGILGFDGAGIEPSSIKDKMVIWRGDGNLCSN